jgi:NhaP-type Na+/H+ or K+/H+ antiporter
MYAALDVEPVLNMLVFGESILNDAVAIVLTTTIIGGHTSRKKYRFYSVYVCFFVTSVGDP